MNDVTQTQLKVVVERAVRPVRATMARKRQMREELLSHLVATFEEELEKAGDEQAALGRAERRFGDPKALSEQLQDTVSWWNQFEAYSDKQYYLRPGESLWHFTGRFMLFVGAQYVVPSLAVPPILLLLGKQDRIGLAIHILVVICIFGWTFSFLSAVLPDRIGRALFGRDSERSRMRAGLYCLASLAIFPAIAFFTYWALSSDLAASFHHLLFGCYFAIVAPPVLIATAWHMAKTRRSEEEWTSLRIEE